MSDTLTTDAPALGSAAPSVEEVAPETTGEANGGSEDGELIPVARFNGLMSSFNKAQTRVAALEAEVSELRSGLNSKPEQEKPAPVSDELLAVVTQLREELTGERMKNARRAVLDDYPEAKPFADLIVADSEEELREMAKVISERVKGIAPAPAGTPEVPVAETTSTTETPAPPGAPVESEPVITGGGSAIDGDSPLSGRVADAIKNRSFSDFLTARWEQMESDVTAA